MKICELCKTSTTSIQNANNKNKKIYYNWYKFENGYICNVCYNQRRTMSKKTEQELKSRIMVCSKCNSTRTKINAAGRYIWRFMDKKKNSDRICYYCFLQVKRARTLTSSGSYHCESNICSKYRNETTSGYNYTNFNFCSECRVNFPKSYISCPCCRYLLRKSPRKHKKLSTKGLELKPLVYY